MTHLDDEQVDCFHRDGCLIVENLFQPAEDLDPLIAEYCAVLDRLAEELRGKGEISSTYAELPFGRRLMEIYKESGRVHAQYFDFALPHSNVTESTPLWTGPAVFGALRNEKLLDAVESIIGPEIYSNPIQHVRLKPPERLISNDSNNLVATTPPHQDGGVVLPEADKTEMLTVWVPLWDVTVENGCLCVWPGSHRHGLLDHCPGAAGLRIPEALVPGRATPLPMKRGDVLFLNKLSVHASLPNRSDHVRWSFDLRYHPIGQPTGRSRFPGFVARSRRDPASELRDAAEWSRLWRTARSKLANEHPEAFNRWSGDNPLCA